MIIERRRHLRQVAYKINHDFAIKDWGEIQEKERVNYAQLCVLLVESAVIAWVIVGWLSL